jgi:ubiquinone/menaquinone biosynthesis C-methylase UbiE
MVLADYNDKNYDYTKYWQGREYENESEFEALRKLFSDTSSEGKSVIDVGGGFGRLLPVLSSYFTDITIFDYSSKLLGVAQENARKNNIVVNTLKGDVNDLSSLIDKKFNSVTMIRVSHHIDNLKKVFNEVNKILSDDGVFILEVANKIHFKSIVSNLLRGNFKYFNRDSISVATKSVTFLNHHPKKVEELLEVAGFKIEKKLSVSNFRHPLFKKIIPLRLLLFLERFVQKPGALLYFGPSIFYKATKK